MRLELVPPVTPVLPGVPVNLSLADGGGHPHFGHGIIDVVFVLLHKLHPQNQFKTVQNTFPVPGPASDSRSDCDSHCQYVICRDFASLRTGSPYPRLRSTSRLHSDSTLYYMQFSNLFLVASYNFNNANSL
jgi:hypothetical protein